MDDAGNFVATGESWVRDPAKNGGVYTQQFTDAGARARGEFRVNR